MSNSDEAPNFYENEEEEIDENSEKNNKKSKNNKNFNISFDDEIEKEEISKNVTTSMVDPRKQKNSKKNNHIENRILKNIESDDQEEESDKSKKSKSFINQSDDDDEKDDNEPNFYNEEENGENISESEANEKDEEDDNDKSDSEEKKDKYNERNKKKIEELKKKNIDIENIYEINKVFNYSKDNPVFYLKENKNALDKYPWPMSTKQIVNLIEKDNIPYENLKVKLVDIFEFKLRNAFEYVDFIDVIKPEWADNVTYSKIFLDLHNFKINKEKENNIGKDKSKDKEKEKDKSGMVQISQSIIPKVEQSNTFSVEKKFINNFKDNENENEKSDNKKKNYWPRNKKQFKRGKKKAVEIKGGFTYE